MLRPRKKYTVHDLQLLKGKRCLTHIHVKSPEEAAAAEQAAADQAAADAAAAAAAATTEPAADAAAMDPATLLTPEGFDADKVVAMIEGTNLTDQQKTTLSATVRAAASNPALLDLALQQVRAAMGL